MKTITEKSTVTDPPIMRLPLPPGGGAAVVVAGGRLTPQRGLFKFAMYESGHL